MKRWCCIYESTHTDLLLVVSICDGLSGFLLCEPARTPALSGDEGGLFQRSGILCDFPRLVYEANRKPR